MQNAASFNDFIKQHLDSEALMVQMIDEQLDNVAEMNTDDPIVRSFTKEEVASLLDITSATLRKREKSEDWPVKLDKEHRSYNMNDILKCRAHLGVSFRHLNELARVIAFSNSKGGVTKTTTSLYFGMYCAYQGASVCFIDLDPQGSLSQFLGVITDTDSDYVHSIARFIAEAQNGDIDREALLKECRETHLDNVKVLPSTLDLQDLEFDITTAMSGHMERDDIQSAIRTFYLLKRIIEVLRSQFDIIIIDGTPSFGLIPFNLYFAADSVITPVPTESADFRSTSKFLKMLNGNKRAIYERFGDGFGLPPTHRFLAVKYRPSATVSAELYLELFRDVFKDKGIRTVLRPHDSVVSNGSANNYTVFDINPGDINIRKPAYSSAIENFSAVFEEILMEEVYSHWPSKSDVVAAYKERVLNVTGATL